MRDDRHALVENARAPTPTAHLTAASTRPPASTTTAIPVYAQVASLERDGSSAVAASGRRKREKFRFKHPGSGARDRTNAQSA
jgi:hypothetical protein